VNLTKKKLGISLTHLSCWANCKPIVINQDYTLLAGLHRLEAAKLLGWETIKAEVISGSQLEDELIEIDENLIRNDLTVLEQAETVAKKK